MNSKKTLLAAAWLAVCWAAVRMNAAQPEVYFEAAGFSPDGRYVYWIQREVLVEVKDEAARGIKPRTSRSPIPAYRMLTERAVVRRLDLQSDLRETVRELPEIGWSGEWRPAASCGSTPDATALLIVEPEDVVLWSLAVSEWSDRTPLFNERYRDPGSGWIVEDEGWIRDGKRRLAIQAEGSPLVLGDREIVVRGDGVLLLDHRLKAVRLVAARPFKQTLCETVPLYALGFSEALRYSSREAVRK